MSFGSHSTNGTFNLLVIACGVSPGANFFASHTFTFKVTFASSWLTEFSSPLLAFGSFHCALPWAKKALYIFNLLSESYS